MEVIEQKSIEFVPTKQGGMKLLCDGRLYHLRKKYSNGKLYQCYNLRGCRGNVTLDSENKIIKGKPCDIKCMTCKKRNPENRREK